MKATVIMMSVLSSVCLLSAGCATTESESAQWPLAPGA
jgi:hypothetical protein